MLKGEEQSLDKYLSQYITPNKRIKIKEALDNRTKYLTLVLEDIYQTLNASAAIRTCECLGIQNIHIIEKTHKFRVRKTVVRGATKWIDIKRYRSETENSTLTCIKELKAEGYKIAATTPNTEGHDLTTLPLDRKIAVMFGSEHSGLSEEAIAAADYYLKIPIHGFTSSYNISVSVGITMYELLSRIRNSELNWQLSETEKKDYSLEWLKRHVRKSYLLEKNFLKKKYGSRRKRENLITPDEA